MTTIIQAFLSGAVMMGFVTLGLFFLSFYRRTADRLFAFFAGAFFVLAAERLVFVIATPEKETVFLVYTVRLLAFAMLAYAIWDRNRRKA